MTNRPWKKAKSLLGLVMMRRRKQMSLILSILLVFIGLNLGWVSCAKFNSNDTPAPDPVGQGHPPVTNACNATTGLTQALEACTPASPCTNLSEELVLQGITKIDQPSIVPLCRTTASGRAVFNDGPAHSLPGIDGHTRYFCIYRPPTAVQIPLVIWLHGGGGGAADNLYDLTGLRAKAAAGTMDFPNGFALIAIQGRSLHYPTDWPRDGHHYDFYFRSLGVPSQNPDVALMDAVIDQMVNAGGINKNRIYLMGWSNGALFSHMYSIARRQIATAGGNRIAAVATYSGGDPFDQINPSESPSCRLAPYPQADVPLLAVHRDCDAAIACNDLQAGWFNPPPGHNLELWLGRAATQVGFTNIQTLFIDGWGQVATGCATSKNACLNVFGINALPGCPGDVDRCAQLGGLLNHIRWPDGVPDGSGNDYEPQMIEFLYKHNL